MSWPVSFRQPACTLTSHPMYLLLELEHVLIKLLLQLLVRVVDAELLEAVKLEQLEPVNVQDTNKALLRLRRLCASKIVGP